MVKILKRTPEGIVVQYNGTIYNIPQKAYNDFINGNFHVNVPETEVVAERPKTLAHFDFTPVPISKNYDTTLKGLYHGLVDKANGNDTFFQDPYDQGEVHATNPDIDKPNYNNVVKAIDGTWMPVAEAIGGRGFFTALKAAPAATLTTGAGAVLGGETVNGISKATTGRDWGENVSNWTSLPAGITDWTNPGGWIGGATAERRLLNAAYNNITPFSYGNNDNIFSKVGAPSKKEGIIGMAKDMIMPWRSTHTGVNDMPTWRQKIDVTGLTPNEQAMLTFRDEAWRKATRQKPRLRNINGKKQSLYVKNPNSDTYSYNFNYIDDVNAELGAEPLNKRLMIIEPDNPLVAGKNKGLAEDQLTGAGGHVGVEFDLTPSFVNSNEGMLHSPYRIIDKWDTQPFLNGLPFNPYRTLLTKLPKRIAKPVDNYVRNFDAVQGIGGNPFMLDMTVPKGVINTAVLNYEE